MPRRVSKDRTEAAIAELNKVRSEWLRRPNVSAVDVGFKIRERELTDELAVRVHVKRKLPPEALASYEIFTTSDNPESVGAFPIDVIEADYAPGAHHREVLAPEAVDRQSRVDPLVAGISIGNPRVTAGTLGAIVWDRDTCDVLMLSNWHILCGSASCAAGEDIWQPGRFDGGTSSDTVAELLRWQLNADADAAVARLNGARGHTRDVLEWNPITGVEEGVLGMNVVKSGRSTGFTEGLIDGVSLSTTLNYGGGIVQTFSDQLHIVPRAPWPAVDYELSSGGDSGSVWISEASNRAVGLHFAGEVDSSPTAEHAVANRMEKVADLMNISFTPLFCTPDPDPPTWDEDRIRDLIRRIICRYYPWLCGAFPQAPQATSGCGCGNRHAAPHAVGYPGVNVEALVEEALAEIRRQS